MRIISYDIGIKNLAYCIIEYIQEDKKFSIIDWNVLSLLEEETPNVQCSQKIPKRGKNPEHNCASIAQFQKNGQYYCPKHAKACQLIIPGKKHTRPYLKKKKVGELQQLAGSLFLTNSEKNKKDQIVDLIMEHYDKHCLESIIKKKTENAGDADLISIGKRMKQVLDQSPFTNTLTHVIIENQISPIATRMKTLQGMLTQYYIDKNSDLEIEFISSINKLKQFVAGKPTAQETYGFPNPSLSPENSILEPVTAPLSSEENNKSPQNEKPKNIKANPGYKEHKNSGITYCYQILNNNSYLENWKSKLETKKKDDLADCFLQGIWYFQKNKIINIDSNFKIEILKKEGS